MRRRSHVTEPHPPPQRNLLLRPPDKNFREKLTDFFWDKKAKTCLTRTPANWLSVIFYYSLFVGGVILVFYVSMLVAEAVSNKSSERPQYVLEESAIGTTPSVNFFPLRDSRNLIWLSKRRSYKEYVKIISDVFEDYKEKNNSFDPSPFGECSKPPFGYNERAPCIFFRLNRILFWTPKPFAKGDKLPAGMPKEAKDLIDKSDTPKLWLTCNGTTAKDRDHISQDFFQFQGDSGFDTSSYPYNRQEGFLDPIIALKFKDSNAKKVLYSFSCQLWGQKLDSERAKVDVTYYFE